MNKIVIPVLMGVILFGSKIYANSLDSLMYSKVFTIEYNGKEETYGDFLEQNVDKKKIVRDTAEKELQKVITETRNLQSDTTPQTQIDIWDKKLEVSILLVLIKGEPERLRPYVSELQSLGYPISFEELDNAKTIGYAPYIVDPDDLITIANAHPNSVYEKEALYRISTRTYPIISTPSWMRHREKLLIWVLQASSRFIEKYPSDIRIGEVKKALDMYSEMYSICNRTKTCTIAIDGHDIEIFFNDEREESYLNTIFSGRKNPEPYVINIRKLDTIKNDPLGYIDVITKKFSDIKTYDFPLYAFVHYAYSRGYISGYHDGTFHPENPVTRAELAKMLTLAFHAGTGNIFSLTKYSDAPQDMTLAPHLARLQELGVMNGYDDGTLKPNNPVSVGEAMKMTVRVAYPDEIFSDPKNLRNYLTFIQTRFPDLSFLSKDIMTPMNRGEVVEMIEGILEKF